MEAIATKKEGTGQKLHEVAPGILQLRTPLGVGPSHTNAYLIRDGNGWCIFDPGMDLKEGREIWSSALDGPLREGITRIIVSHHHIDHLGLAAWLQESTGAPVCIRPEELETAKAMMHTDPGVAFSFRDHFTRNGFTESDVNWMVDEFMPTLYRCAIPKEIRVPEDGESMVIGRRVFRILLTGGHSVAQVSLYDRADGLLICGDQMFEWITPNIGLWPYGDPEPLSNFLRSLDRFDSEDIRLILPGHYKPYSPRENRAEALRAHHRRMLATFLEHLQGRMTGLELSEAVYGTQPDLLNRIMAFNETLSHLQWLHKEGSVFLHDDEPISRYEKVLR